MADAANELLDKGQQVFVEGELRGEPQDGSQNPRIWAGNDGEYRASYEVTACTVKFLGKREGNGGAPVGEPPPGGEDDDVDLQRCHRPGVGFVRPEAESLFWQKPELFQLNLFRYTPGSLVRRIAVSLGVVVTKLGADRLLVCFTSPS